MQHIHVQLPHKTDGCLSRWSKPMDLPAEISAPVSCSAKLFVFVGSVAVYLVEYLDNFAATADDDNGSVHSVKILLHPFL